MADATAGSVRLMKTLPQMNRERLRQAEASFLQIYPRGFADPAIQPLRKKHNVDRLVRFSRDNLTRVHCSRPEALSSALLKVVSRSSLVSRFEKPRFKEFLASLGSDDKVALAFAVEQRLESQTNPRDD